MQRDVTKVANKKLIERLHRPRPDRRTEQKHSMQNILRVRAAGIVQNIAFFKVGFGKAVLQLKKQKKQRRVFLFSRQVLQGNILSAIGVLEGGNHEQLSRLGDLIPNELPPEKDGQKLL